MKTQALVLLALLCSSAFCQFTETTSIKVGSETQIDLRIGTFGDDCAVQRGDGDPAANPPTSDPPSPSPFLYTIGAAAGDCTPEKLAYVGSYAWAIFRVAGALPQLIDSRTSRSGHVYEYKTRTTTAPVANTLFALKFDASHNQANFGKIVDGYQLYTKSSVDAAQGFGATLADTISCRHHLLIKVDAGSNYLINEKGERSQVTGADVYVGINTRTGEITAYPSGADPCDTIEAIVEEEEEEKSASILSVAALVVLGALAI